MTEQQPFFFWHPPGQAWLRAYRVPQTLAHWLMFNRLFMDRMIDAEIVCILTQTPDQGRALSIPDDTQ